MLALAYPNLVLVLCFVAMTVSSYKIGKHNGRREALKELAARNSSSAGKSS